jgi:hypothetical protein
VKELVAEVLLRLAKVVAAAVVALVLWLILTGPLGAEATPALGLACFIAGGVAVLLMESSPL